MLVVYHGDAGPLLRVRFAEVAAADGFEIEVCAPDDVDRLEELLGQMGVWWHVLSPITAAHLDRAPHLALIQKWGVGVNTIDVAAATHRGIATSNMPGSNASSVAEASLMLMLAAMRRLNVYDTATRQGRGWQVAPAIGEGCGEIAGRRVGLVGYGDIAQRLHAPLEALGAEVRHHSLRSDRPGWMTLDDLCASSDIISLHVPLTDETAHLMDAGRLASMKPGAVLVNTSRGGLVDQSALVAALSDGHLSAAGLDVADTEPVAPDDPLLALDNVIMTPHVAWLTWETLERSLEIARRNVALVRDGLDVEHRVG